MAHIEDYLGYDPRNLAKTHLVPEVRDKLHGKILPEEIDVIQNHPKATQITISGLDQKTFDYFIQKYGKQFEIIQFWKCPRVTDLSAIETLTKVKYLAYFWNQKAQRLWDLSKNTSLIGLAFEDFSQLRHLRDLASSKTLSEVQFGDKVWPKNSVESLAPLENCPTLSRVGIAVKKVLDSDISPLSRIKHLKRLEFANNLFTTEQIAWLKAHSSNDLESTSLIPCRKIRPPVKGMDKDTIIAGKGKPFLSSTRDSAKIEKYAKSFEDMVIYYKKNDTEHAPKPK